jgi:hypothetical protein
MSLFSAVNPRPVIVGIDVGYRDNHELFEMISTVAMHNRLPYWVTRIGLR